MFEIGEGGAHTSYVKTSPRIGNPKPSSRSIVPPSPVLWGFRLRVALGTSISVLSAKHLSRRGRGGKTKKVGGSGG